MAHSRPQHRRGPAVNTNNGQRQASYLHCRCGRYMCSLVTAGTPTRPSCLHRTHPIQLNTEHRLMEESGRSQEKARERPHAKKRHDKTPVEESISWRASSTEGHLIAQLPCMTTRTHPQTMVPELRLKTPAAAWHMVQCCSSTLAHPQARQKNKLGRYIPAGHPHCSMHSIIYGHQVTQGGTWAHYAPTWGLKQSGAQHHIHNRQVLWAHGRHKHTCAYIQGAYCRWHARKNALLRNMQEHLAHALAHLRTVRS